MQNSFFRILIFIIVLLFGGRAVGAADAVIELQRARQFLTGERKNTDAARRLLLDLVVAPDAIHDPNSLYWSCVYLGYLEDRAGNRDAAIGWYKKAIAVEGADPGVAYLASDGLKQPLLWIRHLDSVEATAKQAITESHKPPEQPNRRGSAHIANLPPDLTLATNLTAKERQDNFEALWSIIDSGYADFALKSIDWQQVGMRYLNRLKSISSDDDFYFMMYQLVNELKDTHSWLNNYKPPALMAVRELPTDLFEDRPFVVAGEKAGWEVLTVDGMTIPERIESLRPFLKACSSERAFRREAARLLLAGNASDSVSVRLRSPQGEVETFTLKRGGRPLPALSRQTSIILTKHKFVDFGRYPSGLGYIQVHSFEGSDEITKEFDQALDSLRDTSGLMLDIRDNQGGLNHDDIVGRFLHKETFVGYSYIKNGLKHNQFKRKMDYIEPRGWEYKKPVALLINDRTGSAADLFTRGMRAAPRVTTIGTTTHGNLSGEAIFAVLPCGLVVRISSGYLTDTKDRSIEVNGNVPDVKIETSIQDYLEARDPVLEQASEVLLASTDRVENQGK